METILELEDYKVYYKTLSGYVRAVDGVSFTIKKGEIVGLIGESGCGKSTLIMSLVIRKPPMIVMGGKARLKSIDLVNISEKERRKILLTNISIIPQYALDALPTIKKIKTFLKDIAKDKGVPEEEVLEKFMERARIIGLPSEVVNMYPIELSGGMRQRVVITLATIFSPDLLIADEPTSALDVTTQRHVLELLAELRDTGIIGSLIFVTHDIASVRQIADKIIVMYAGKVVEIGETEDIVTDPKHPYTRKLIEAVPKLGINYKKKRLSGLPGSPPSLLNPPPGCRFHPRCPLVMATCKTREPPLKPLNGTRLVACWLYDQSKGEQS